MLDSMDVSSGKSSQPLSSPFGVGQKYARFLNGQVDASKIAYVPPAARNGMRSPDSNSHSQTEEGSRRSDRRSSFNDETPGKRQNAFPSFMINREHSGPVSDDKMEVCDSSSGPDGRLSFREQDQVRSRQSSGSAESRENTTSERRFNRQYNIPLSESFEHQRRELERANDQISSLRQQIFELQNALSNAEETASEDRTELLAAKQEIMTYQHTLQSSQSALSVQHRVTKALREEASTLQNMMDAERQRAIERSELVSRLENEVRHFRGEQQVVYSSNAGDRRSIIRSPRALSPREERRQEIAWKRSPPRNIVTEQNPPSHDRSREHISAPPPLTSIQPKEDLSPEATSPHPLLTPNQQFPGRGRWPGEIAPRSARHSQDVYLTSPSHLDSRSSAPNQTFKGRRHDLHLTNLQGAHAVAINSPGASSAPNGEYPSAISRFEKIVMVPENAGKLRPYLEQWLQKTDEAARLSEQSSPHPVHSPLLTSPPPHSPAYISSAPNVVPSAVHLVRVPHYSETLAHADHRYRQIIPHPSQLHQVHHPPGTISIPALRKRKRRLVLEPETRAILEQQFALQPKPTPDELVQLAQELDLEKEEVRVWFCNRRQKEKRLSSVSTAPIRFDWPPAPTQTSPTAQPSTTSSVASRTTADQNMSTISPGLPLLDSAPAHQSSAQQASPDKEGSCDDDTSSRENSESDEQ